MLRAALVAVLFTTVPAEESIEQALRSNDECLAGGGEGCAVNALQARVAKHSTAANATWWSNKVICPGYGFYSAACYGTLQQFSPSTIIAWSGGTSTAALGFAIHPSSISAFAAWVKTHPDYTGWGTPFEFYKQALTPSVFSWLNSRLYLGMGCGLYYYLLHDFSSAEDMAKALCTSGGESFTGSTTVNGVDLSTCTDSFGGAEALYGGIPSQAKASIGGSSGYWVNVYSSWNALPVTPSDITSIVNSAWYDYKDITTNLNFETNNCLCSQQGCTFGC